MKRNNSKILSVIIVALINLVLLLFMKFNTSDTSYLVLFAAIAVDVITIIYNLINSISDINKVPFIENSYMVAEPFGRKYIVEEIVKRIVNDPDKHVIYINCSSINKTELENLKLTIYTQLGKIEHPNLSIRKTISFDCFDLNELNRQIFNGKKKTFKNKIVANVYIYDYLTTSAYYIENIDKRYANKQKEDAKALTTSYFIFFTDLKHEDEITLELDNNAIQDMITVARANNEESEIFNLKEGSINSVLPFQEVLQNKTYFNIVKNNNSYIIPLYFMHTGEYEKALNILLNDYELNYQDEYLSYLLADCLHYLNMYDFASSVIDMCTQSTSKLSLEFELLKIHVLKHQGEFVQAIEEGRRYNKNKSEIDDKLLSIYYLNYLQNCTGDMTKDSDYIQFKSLLEQPIKSQRKQIYKAVLYAHTNIHKALTTIDNCIFYFEKTNDRYRYNAYYIKAEILRIMNSFDEAYQYYLKASGMEDGHNDLNLLEQTYFSTKALEKLGFVKGDLSTRIVNYKNLFYKNNYRKLKDDTIVYIKNKLKISQPSIIMEGNKIRFYDYLNGVLYGPDNQLQKELETKIFIIL